MENKQSSNNLGSGFFLGLIVGVIVTLLFTTKKGRKILHNLTEKSMDKVSTIENRFHEVKENVKEDIQSLKADLEEIEEDIRDTIVDELPDKKIVHHKPHVHEEEDAKKSPVKKFFSKKN
ncbi:MAG: YtxH domain-containing protein [Patescibacteria group bacterium]